MYARLLYCALVLLLSACVSSPRSVIPLTQANNNFLANEDEKKLLGSADDAHRELVKRGLLVVDADATAYLESIGSRLRPAIAHGPELHYYVLKDASVNAMAFPNGNVYVNVGLIARLDSEDQLALVLAHETAHVVQRHSYKGMLDRHNTVVAAHVTDLLLAGTGIAYLPFIANLAQFSREQEKEADLCGIDYMVGKGYDLDASVEVFDKLVEVKHARSDASVWNDHPDLNSRKVYTRQKIAAMALDPVPPHDNTAYRTFRNKQALLAIQLRMLNRQYELALDAIDFEIAHQGDSAQWRVYRGDALRESAEHSDAAALEYAWLYDKSPDDALKKQFEQKAPLNYQSALEEYQRALRLDPKAATALRGIGLVAYRQGETQRAAEYLHNYLAAAAQAGDRRYIESLLKQLEH